MSSPPRTEVFDYYLRADRAAGADTPRSGGSSKFRPASIMGHALAVVIVGASKVEKREGGRDHDGDEGG